MKMSGQEHMGELPGAKGTSNFFVPLESDAIGEINSETQVACRIDANVAHWRIIPSMKLLPIILALTIAVAGSAKEEPLTETDLMSYAVFETTAVSLPDGGKDNYIVRWIDGKEIREAAQFRFEKGDAGKTLKIFTLIVPGARDVTLRYFGTRKHGILGAKYFAADFTQHCILKPGRYLIFGSRDEQFASFSLRRRDSGELLVENARALIQKADSPWGPKLILLPLPTK